MTLYICDISNDDFEYAVSPMMIMNMFIISNDGYEYVQYL